MQQNTPAAPAVRETLSRLLASETFGRSERARKLIQYLVERDLAGEAERLKGYSIAVDVFDKDSEFDPATDSVVRVQAGRLRELLSQYYASEGAEDPIRISVPRGSYVPEYTFTTAAEAGATGSKDVQDEGRNIGVIGAIGGHPVTLQAGGVSRKSLLPEIPILAQLRLIWFVVALLVAVLAVVLYQAFPSTTSEIVTAATGQTLRARKAVSRVNVDALPTIHIRTTHDDKQTGRVASVLRRALAGFDTVSLIAAPPADDGVNDSLDFVFEVSDGVDPGSVIAELQHVASRKVLLSRKFSSEEVLYDLDDQVAAMLSSAIPASGILYAHIEQNNLQRGLTNCLLLNDDFYLNQTAANHVAAYRCFEALIKAGSKSPLVYSELASLHLKTLTDGYLYPPGATAEQAMELARTGVLMGPTSPYAHRAYGYVNSRVGTAEESVRWMKKAYELNTFDLSMAAAYANSLIFSGAYAQGVPLMKRAAELSSAHPTWWDYGLFLGQFMLGNDAEAAQAADALVTARRSHYLAARLVVAYRASDFATSNDLVKQLQAADAKFAANPHDYFVKANYPPDLADKFSDALRAAGLGSGS